MSPCVALILSVFSALTTGDEKEWEVHDRNRPQPAVVDPGAESPGTPPSDAVVLFDGKDLSAWATADETPVRWKVENGAMTAARGDVHTRRSFGSCQLHLEWAAPAVVKGTGQGRGNSGVFLMSRYEVQILDSYENETYPDGQAGSVYGQNPPLVNACRKPGEWQTYDIVFRRPHFDPTGKAKRAATITVFHNGVLVQDHFEIQGSTRHKLRGAYVAHADKLPLRLQDHGNPLRFRNIWVRELED